MTLTAGKCARAFGKTVLNGALAFWCAGFVLVAIDASLEKLADNDVIDIQDTYEYTDTPAKWGNIVEAYNVWKESAQDIPEFDKMSLKEVETTIKGWADERSNTHTNLLNNRFLAASVQAKALKDMPSASMHRRMNMISRTVQNLSSAFAYIEPGKETFQTIKEVLQDGGGDCDSMERITHHLLLQAGFDKNDLRRGIIFEDKARIEGGERIGHMVTFVFEKGSNDPWVIDPTGAATTKVAKMSDVKDWHATKTADTANIYKVNKDRTISIS